MGARGAGSGCGDVRPSLSAWLETWRFHSGVKRCTAILSLDDVCDDLIR